MSWLETAGEAFQSGLIGFTCGYVWRMSRHVDALRKQIRDDSAVLREVNRRLAMYEPQGRLQ